MPLAVITALILTSLVAVRVSLLALQVMASLTVTLPSLPPPLVLAMATSAVARLLLRVAPLISPPLAAIVKPSGSSSQRPDLPCAARASTRVASRMVRWLAEVSMKPPSPPLSPPRALKLPLTSVRLAGLARSAIRVTVPPRPALPGAALALMVPPALIWSDAASMMRPPSLVKPFASSAPLLLITPPIKRLAAWADMMMVPPGASTACRFSTRAAIADGVTTTPARVLLSPNCSLICSPDASATVPARAMIRP